MNTKLKITKDGLKAWEWDGEEKSQHRIKQVDKNKFQLIHRKTKEVVREGKSHEELEEIFWKPKEIKDTVWHLIRESCEIEDGTTLGDLYDIIDNDDSLSFLVENWYPLYKTLSSNHDNDVKEFVIKKIAYIMDGQFTIAPEPLIPSPVLSDIPLKLDKRIDVWENGQKIHEGEFYYSLLDIIDSVFDSARLASTSQLTKEGLTELYTSIGSLVDNPFNYLMSPCIVDEDLTLQDIFDFVEKHEDLKVFIDNYSWCKVDVFHKAAKEPREENNLRNLVVAKYVEFDSGEYASVNYHVDFGGEGPPDEYIKKQYGKEPIPEIITYGISFSPMSRLAHLPIKIEKEAGIYKDLLPTERKVFVEYTLLDILDAIYWEISFNGTPEQAKEMLGELNRRAEEIKSGEIEGKSYKSVEEMMKDLEGEDDDE